MSWRCGACRVMRDRFYQFSWRPRPPSLLSPEKVKEIARNLRKYSEKYAKEDESLMAQADTDLLSDRRARMDEWQAWLDSHREWREAQLKAREAIIAAKYPQANEPDTYTTEQARLRKLVSAFSHPCSDCVRSGSLLYLTWAISSLQCVPLTASQTEHTRDPSNLGSS